MACGVNNMDHPFFLLLTIKLILHRVKMSPSVVSRRRSMLVGLWPGRVGLVGLRPVLLVGLVGLGPVLLVSLRDRGRRVGIC